ncbi:hypothetical protein KGF54_001049 [Candida jiufengensis]|uniref:uncharacterized protein n=1 Tax=Candida jiufengensis TaxID=497108 RepID=UPI00222419C5|nr:uncharacterized protein KGF54_001049 [Candida jiufengensis]KAI5956574.1 hypothetical protein KGF54_001049 [Candida jiufengensis]
MSTSVQLSTRKSNRIRNLTPKAITNNLNFLVSSQQQEQQQQPIKSLKRSSEDNTSTIDLKKRKKSSTIEEEEAKEAANTDKIDPVEKLLSLTNMNNDFILDLDITEPNSPISDSIKNSSSISSNGSISSIIPTISSKRSSSLHSLKNCSYNYEDSEEDEDLEEDEEPIEIESVNFTQILQDNIRNYYKLKLQNQYKDSFTLLNNKNLNIYSGENLNVITKDSNNTTATQSSSSSSVPFFKNVNFGRFKEYSVEDFVTYGEEEEEKEEEKEEKELQEPKVEQPSIINAPIDSIEDEDPISTTVSPISSPTTSNISLTTSTNTTPATTSPMNSNLYIPKLNNNWFKNQQSLLSSSYNQSSSQSLNFDISNALKKHSLYTASEMVSTGNFMINDFYL